jgi:hypothetical protein
MLSKSRAGNIVGLVALLAVAAFMILGFTTDAWYLAWLVFLAIPVTAVLTDILSKRKDVASLVAGLTALLAIAAYMIMGFVYDLWHPGWLVFLAIPISSIIVNLIKDTPESGKEADKKAEEPKE